MVASNINVMTIGCLNIFVISTKDVYIYLPATFIKLINIGINTLNRVVNSFLFLQTNINDCYFWSMTHLRIYFLILLFVINKTSVSYIQSFLICTFFLWITEIKIISSLNATSLNDAIENHIYQLLIAVVIYFDRHKLLAFIIILYKV